MDLKQRNENAITAKESAFTGEDRKDLISAMSASQADNFSYTDDLGRSVHVRVIDNRMDVRGIASV